MRPSDKNKRTVSWATTPPLKHFKPQITTDFPPLNFSDSSKPEGRKSPSSRIPLSSSKSSPTTISSKDPSIIDSSPTLNPTPIVLRKASNMASAIDSAPALPHKKDQFLKLLDSIKTAQIAAASSATQSPVAAVVDHKTDIAPATPFFKPSIIEFNSQTPLAMKENHPAGNFLVPKVPPKPSLDHVRLMALEVLIHDEHVQIIRALVESHQSKVITLHITGDWKECIISSGTFIHIVFQSLEKMNDCLRNQSEWHISNDDLIITNPDELVSITTVADSFQCVRRSIVKDKVRIYGSSNESMVYGNIMHALFQSAMQSNNFSRDWLLMTLKDLVYNSADELYGISQNEESALNALLPCIDQVIAWKDKNYTLGHPSSYQAIRVVKALDIEERIWSPKYGLKGNIDVTAQIKTPGSKNYIAPLELKTGKAQSISHNAQTLFYTMMLADRHDVEVDAGLLVYLKKNETVTIKPNVNEKRGVLIARNNVVHYLAADELPQMLGNIDVCRRCFSLKECMIFHKTIENGTAESSGVGPLFDQETGFITQKHGQFMKTWESAIKMEQSKNTRNTQAIWTLDVEVREKMGTCIDGLVIQSSKSFSKSQARFKYSYEMVKLLPKRTPSTQSGASSNDFIGSHFMEGDPIIVTEQGSTNPLGIGFLFRINARSILISTDKPIHAKSILTKTGTIAESRIDGEDAAKRVFTIDKDGFASGMGNIRGNLFELFLLTGERRRRLIVDLIPPEFSLADTHNNPNIDPSLNSDQKEALLKVTSCRDYALILGMPGTGKTTVIAQIIKLLVSQGKSVSLTSFTHSAVDNVLLKLIEIGVGFVRLGATEKMHPAIKTLTLEQRELLDDTSKISLYYDTAKVVATTALGINHSLFSKRLFDYCIVDESSQIALPVSLGPLQFAEKFVLVGDHYQLPPLFAQDESRSTETLSLFKHLCQAHPQAVCTLKTQYRMNKDITNLANHLIYDYRLKPGNTKISNGRLSLQNVEEYISKLHSEASNSNGKCRRSGQCWLDVVLSPKSVLFLDTDLIPAHETKVGPWIENNTEANLVHQVVLAMVSCGIEQRDIGVISPYRHQLKKIVKKLENYPEIEILTVDKYQGRDKKCIIMSMTRSNSACQAGELLKDWQRLNVAITRAKHKLVMIGSKSTLSATKPFEIMFQFLEKKSWIYTMEKDSHMLHPVPDSSLLSRALSQNTYPATPLQLKATFGRPPLSQKKMQSDLF